VVTGTQFYDTTSRGFTVAQLYSTQSYAAKNLSGIILAGNNLTGWDFHEQNLANARLHSSTLTNANLSGANLANANLDTSTLTNANLNFADTRGSTLFNAIDFGSASMHNMIRPDGKLAGFNLSDGKTFLVRDYDGNPARSIGPLPITVQTAFTVAPQATLQFAFAANSWDSTIGFQPNIPVTRAGTLDLGFANGVNPSGQVGRTFRLFDWSGVNPSGVFAVSSPYAWNLANLYTTGQVTLNSVVVGDTLTTFGLRQNSLTLAVGTPGTFSRVNLVAQG